MYSANEALALWFDNEEESQIVLNQFALDCEDYGEFREGVEEYYSIYEILDTVESNVIREFFLRGWQDIDWYTLYVDMRENAKELGFTATNEQYEEDGAEI